MSLYIEPTPQGGEPIADEEYCGLKGGGAVTWAGSNGQDLVHDA
jgi:hypothetical protein